VLAVALAILLINTEIGGELDVFEKLREMKQVREAYITYGTFDIVAKIEAPTLGEIQKVVNEIRSLRGVRSTLTLITVEGKHFQK
jgi:DNA-binding Lrp family transcriptional regulator